MNIFELSKGNPGALNCIMSLINDDVNLVYAMSIIRTVQKLNIIGTDLYVLWSDLCNKDYELMSYLCKEVPGDILKNASSRQDYSGKGLVKQYVENFMKQQIKK